jgi:hypothetical protein
VAAFKQRQWPRFIPAWEKYHGVTPDDLRRITAAVAEVLPGRVPTRDELATEIAAALHRPALAEKIRSSWGVMLKPTAAGGLLCFGHDRDRNVTFTDPRSPPSPAPGVFLSTGRRPGSPSSRSVPSALPLRGPWPRMPSATARSSIPRSR